MPDRLPEVVRGPVGGPVRVLARAGSVALDPESVSTAQPWQWADTDGLRVHGLLHAPRAAGVEGPEGELPPLLVMVHGGPTGRTEASFSTTTQFWTSRGFAVLQVNYSGSTGYGRAYRDRLLGRWGQLDIDDCVTGALSLALAGRVDPTRLAIRGGSAGGYAVLRAMTTSRAFAAGTSLFGVADLAAMAAETHKFESRYLDRLVAPWPEGEAVYRDRSPIHHVDRLHGELLLLQGADDKVVPLAQAQDMAEAMRAAGRDVELTVYEGEGHGFRRAESIVDALGRELAFYQRALRLGAATEHRSVRDQASRRPRRATRTAATAGESDIEARQCTSTRRVGSGSRTGRATTASGSRPRPSRGTSATASPCGDQLDLRGELHAAEGHPRGRGGLAEHVAEPLVADGALRGRHPDVLEQVARRHERPRGQWVVAVHEQVGDVGQHRLAAQRGGHPEAHALPAVHDRDVGAPGRDLGHGIPRLDLVHDDVEVGRLPGQLGQHGRHDAPHGGGEGGQAQQAGRAAGVPLHARAQPLDLLAEHPPLVDEPAAGRGEHHPAPGPLEQRRADLPLEPLDLLGDRRRREAELGRRAADAAAALDGDEGLQGREIDHEAMLPRTVKQTSLVLHGGSG